MSTLKEIARKTLSGGGIYRKLSDKYSAYRLKAKGTEDVFTDIYKQNYWQGKESVSGTGSDKDQVRFITDKLPRLFQAIGAKTVLDLPCGDFLWMNEVDLEGVDYIGGDIVKELIADNTVKFSRENVRFDHINLLEDRLPEADVVIVRDCLVHFSYNDIFKALRNICDSNIKYLLATTFTNERGNRDIATGQWRPLNLERAPINLPKPPQAINEGCTEGNGLFADKSLGLWKVDDIREAIKDR